MFTLTHNHVCHNLSYLRPRTSSVQDMRLGNAYAVLDSNTACLSYSDASPGAAQHTVGWLTTLAI